MGRGRSKFRMGDLFRAIGAVQKAGIEPDRVEFDQEGRPVICLRKDEKPRHAESAASAEDELKRWRERKNAHRS
jgi:hypothetical protein